jgi:hypothetical protein
MFNKNTTVARFVKARLGIDLRDARRSGGGASSAASNHTYAMRTRSMRPASVIVSMGRPPEAA